IPDSSRGNISSPVVVEIADRHALAAKYRIEHRPFEPYLLSARRLAPLPMNSHAEESRYRHFDQKFGLHRSLLAHSKNGRPRPRRILSPANARCTTAIPPPSLQPWPTDFAFATIDLRSRVSAYS